MVLVFQVLFFLGDVLGLECLVAEFEELIAPFVVLGLGDLLFGAEFGDLDLAAHSFDYDTEFLLAGPRAFIHRTGLLVGEPILT